MIYNTAFQHHLYRDSTWRKAISASDGSQQHCSLLHFSQLNLEDGRPKSMYNTHICIWMEGFFNLLSSMAVVLIVFTPVWISLPRVTYFLQKEDGMRFPS